MKELQLFILISLLCLTSFSQKLVILHTNDIHSKVTGFGPERAYTPTISDSDATIGGFARLSALVKAERAKSGDAVILCDAGDYLMGSIFQSIEPSTGFELGLMNDLGYDAITIGNHEFDFGLKALSDGIYAAKNNNNIPPIVASQFIFSDQSSIDDDMEKLFEEGVIKPYTVIERQGLRIGFFGLLGDEAQMVSQGATPMQFRKVIKAAKEMTKILREKEKVDIVICLSHSGVYPNKKGVIEGEDTEIARKVKDIDIIISGHSHVVTPNYLQVGKTIIVQTGCFLQNLGRLAINYDNGKITVDDFKLIELNDNIKGDPIIHKKIEDCKKIVDKKFFKPYGLNYSNTIAETDFKIYENFEQERKPSSIGNLITDAIKYYTDTYSTGTQITMAAQGLIRESILVGEITAADIFRIAPLGSTKDDYVGYSLAKVYVTGRDIKKLAELAILAAKPGSASYLYFSGLKIVYKPHGTLLNKVSKILVDGKEINFSKRNNELYSFTTNLYLLSFLDDVKEKTMGLIQIYPKDANGKIITDFNDYILDFDKNKPGVQEGKEWLAIIEYLKHFEDTNNNGVPNIPAQYKTFVETFVKRAK